MSIATEEWPDFDPGEFYSRENRPPREEQDAFLHFALLEAAQINDPARYAKGPFGEHFATILEDIDKGLQELGPDFTPEYLMPYGYQSQIVRAMSVELEPDERLRLGRLPEIRNIIQEELEKALQGGQTAQQAMDAAVARGNKVLRDFEKSART